MSNTAASVPCGQDWPPSESAHQLVAEQAPRLMAVIRTWHEPAHEEIAAWGLAFDDRIDLTSVPAGLHATVRGLDSALFLFSRGDVDGARIVWLDNIIR